MILIQEGNAATAGMKNKREVKRKEYRIECNPIRYTKTKKKRIHFDSHAIVFFFFPCTILLLFFWWFHCNPAERLNLLAVLPVCYSSPFISPSFFVYFDSDQNQLPLLLSFLFCCWCCSSSDRETAFLIYIFLSSLLYILFHQTHSNIKAKEKRDE